MTRMKVKGFLLSIILAMVCCCFFACKENTTVNVESIGFVEQSISLLVGEEYTPTIKVLPSYATTRSYTLVSTDTSALKVEGGTITALKAIQDVKLKVISDDNKNINDVISVSIWNEAVQLEVPTELKFDGNEFSFVGKDNANSYVLKIDNQEINIGNNVEYSFDKVLNKLTDLNNRVLTCSVKAVGDGKIFKDSVYSEPISFVKLDQVQNAYIENQTLYFDSIKDVASYEIIINEGEQLKTIVNSTFDEKQLSLSLSDLTDSINGGEYKLSIKAKVEGYNQQVDVFGGDATNLEYKVLAQVQNVKMNNGVISWGFVNNALNYTVKLYKNGQLFDTYQDIVANVLRLNVEESGNYYCEVLANSNEKNTTTGKIASIPLEFKVLDIPQININNNTVLWNKVEDAEGYYVTIKTSDGGVLVDKSFVLAEGYDVSRFGVGTYTIEAIACGNGGNVDDEEITLSSQMSQVASWTKLDSVKLIIKNQILYWQDLEPKSLNTYKIVYDGVEEILTQANYDASTNKFSYDLSNHTFTPNKYTISVQSLGANNVFDANVSNIEITKLQEASTPTLNNKIFTVNQVENATSYTIEVYSASDLNTKLLTLNTEASGNQFKLDDSDLSAGDYVAKVFVYGDKETIFDSDNSKSVNTFTFEKLPTPRLSLDNTDIENPKLVIDKVEYLEGENKVEATYQLYEIVNDENANDISDNISNRGYLLTGLTAGKYNYKVKAQGNGANVLDSEFTIESSQISVKKLATPSIEFNKETLVYTISSDDAAESLYNFTLNNNAYSVGGNGKVDCLSWMQNIGEYTAKVWANPVLNYSEYNLIIKSETQSHKATRLNGDCDFSISEDGALVVTPSDENVNETNGQLSLSLRVENGENDIVLTGFTYTRSRFELDLQDADYNTIEALQDLMSSAGKYLIYTTISQTNKNVITSNEFVCQDDESNNVYLKILDKVTSINKNGQAIEFSVVANATNYFAIITLNGTESAPISLKDKYTQGSVNTLKMVDLLEVMAGKVEYLEQVPYEIKFVAVSSDTTTLANKGTSTYTFEFLKTPAISIIEVENSNDKYLSIANEDSNTSVYNIIIAQQNLDELPKGSNETVTLNLDNLEIYPSLAKGEVAIKVSAKATSGHYFESKYNTLVVNKLDSSAISIENGILTWNAISYVKQYNLIVSNTNGTRTISLNENSENFSISGAKCTYDFVSLEGGVNTTLYLQVDSMLEGGGTYCLNSNDGEKLENMRKLETLKVQVKNGELYTEISNLDMTLLDRIEVFLDGELVEGLDITTQSEDIQITESASKYAITINPSILLKYGETELLKETIALKSYSKEGSNALNSSIEEKEVYGLLNPINLDIVTSINQNVEVIEEIKWNNPSANLNHVVGYEVIISYNEKDYKFTIGETILLMPTFVDEDGDGVLDKGEDVNENGVLDEGEVEFGAGIYTIKVRALTDNSNNITNSAFCEPIIVTILETPTNLSVDDGDVVWSNDVTAGYYLVKVYMLNWDEENSKLQQQLIVSNQARSSKIDLTTLEPFNTGVYGVSVQAMHDNPRILSSKESDILQVVRLPQVESYFIKGGELYINVHEFFTKAEIYLTHTNPVTGNDETLSEPFVIVNDNLDNYYSFVESESFSWVKSEILDTYTSTIAVKYTGADSNALTKALAKDYKLSIKLYGNRATKGAIISGYKNTNVINAYWEEDNTVEVKNKIEKLPTPNLIVSETERGKILLNIPQGFSYSLNYLINGENALKGVHIYQINILTDKKHTFYMAEIVNRSDFEQSLAPYLEEGQNYTTTKNGLEYFTYPYTDKNGTKNITFNVFTKNADGYAEFDFTKDYYGYYTYDGKYSGDLTDEGEIKLSNGGSFDVNVRFMGDDSLFVQSDMTEIVTIQRYKVLNLIVEGGNISWANQATDSHHPIYLLTLTTDGTESYNLVLYSSDENIHQLADIKNCLDSGKTYIFDTITYQVQDENITYKGLAKVIDEARKVSTDANIRSLVGLGGNFTIKIKTHYTDKSAMDVILAQDGNGKTATVLPQSQISVADGNLTWAMSYASTINGRVLITDYLLQVFEGEVEKYSIKLEEDDYSIINNQVIYQLPEVLNNGEGEAFTFTSGGNYIFKLTAIGTLANSYVNSTITNTNEIKLLERPENVEMKDGVLTWTNTSNPFEVVVTYEANGNTITMRWTETDGDFSLPEEKKDDSGTLRKLIAGYSYHLNIRVLGNDNQLSSFFRFNEGDTDIIVAERLQTIDIDSISTNNGVLTWTAVSQDDATYTVVYTVDGVTTTSEMLKTNEFDMESVTAGDITINAIYAHHNDHFTSLWTHTTTKQVFKLSTIDTTTMKITEDTTTISWNKVLNKDGTVVESYKVSVWEDLDGDGVIDLSEDINDNGELDEGEDVNNNGVLDKSEITEYICTNSQWFVEGVTSTAFKIAIKAINQSENGTTINSDYTPYQSVTIPKQVDASTFKWIDEIKAFEWQATDEWQDSDRYYIGYNYFETILEEGETIDNVAVTEIEVTNTKIIDNVRYYYYYPHKIGSYRTIYVQIKRGDGSLASQKTNYADGNGLDFDIFASGDGDINAYSITSEEHLRNIKYFPNAKYILNANIELSLQEDVEDSMMITDEETVFTGTINGNYKQIICLYQEIDQMATNGYVGLFRNVKNATFTNLTLTGFSLNRLVNNPTTFKDDKTVFIGVLAGYAENSTFNNITISSTSINVVKSTSNGYVKNAINVYVGAVAGYVIGGQFSRCTIVLGETQEVKFNIEGNSQTKFTFGAIAGYAESCKIANTNATTAESNAFTISTATSGGVDNPEIYIGSLVGVSSGANEITSNSCKYIIKGNNEAQTNEVGKQK